MRKSHHINHFFYQYFDILMGIAMGTDLATNNAVPELQ